MNYLNPEKCGVEALNYDHDEKMKTIIENGK